MEKRDIKIEAVAGITTFFKMAYIIVVNPSILSSDGTGLPFSGVMTATVAVSFLMTLLMGIYADLPFAVAPGMGVNAFFTYSIILGRKIPWPVALGIIFWSGVFFVLISLTPLRSKVAMAIPKNIQNAAAVGIGIFLTFIGLKNCGFIVANPTTFVKPGPLNFQIALSVAGLGLILFLQKKKNPLAFLIGIFSITIISIFVGMVKLPEHFFSPPDFQSVFFKLNIWGALKLSLIPSIMSILFTDFFDSISTFIGVARAGKLLDKNGEPKNLRQGLIVDAFATLGAGLVGTSSGTAFIESAAGIEMGGRTGLTSIFTALCFLPCLFLSPIAGVIPPYATAPVLILVGALMFRTISEIKFDKLEDAIPSFLTIILIPLSFSITQGLLWGFISHVACYLIFGRRKDLNPTICGLSLLAIFLLIIDRNG